MKKDYPENMQNKHAQQISSVSMLVLLYKFVNLNDKLLCFD